MNLPLAGIFLLAAAASSEPRIAPAPADRLVLCNDVQDPSTLDPHKQFSEKAHTLLQQIFEGLVRFDSQGHIEPALALSWKRIDSLSWRFKLRQGVLFHDGTKFDAEAVRYTLQRYLDPATESPAAGFIDTISRVEVVDSFTVDIHTSLPDGILLNRLAGFVVIVPPGFGRAGAKIEPVGTGAFRFESWKPGQSITLAANTNYWDPARPKMKALEFRFIKEEDQLAKLINGEIDLLTSLPGTQTLEVRRNPDFQIQKTPIYYTVGVTLRTEEGPLADKRVRRAMNHAVSKADLIRYDLRGNGKALASLSFPGAIGHNVGLKPYAYDPALAKKLLREAGHSNGLTLQALIETNVERTGRVIASQLERIGIKLEVAIAPDSLTIEYMQKKKFDIAIGSAPNPMLHPYFTHAILLSSKSPYSLVRDEKYDQMLDRVAQTLDEKEQGRLSQELDRYVYDEALTLFTYQRVQTAAMKKELIYQAYVSGMPYFYDSSWKTSRP